MFTFICVVHLIALGLVNFKSPASYTDASTSKFDKYYAKYYTYVRWVAGLFTSWVG